jgi:diguanylate cyclase (GGDEF)-like protein/PAS domain S-box-containing protein
MDDSGLHQPDRRQGTWGWLTPSAVAWLLYGTVLTLVVPVLPPVVATNLLGLAQLVACLLVVVGLARLSLNQRRPPRVRRALLLLASAFAMLALGNVVIAVGSDPARLVLGNLMFVGVYPLAVGGLLLVPRVRRGRSARTRHALDVAASTIGFTMLVVVLVVEPARNADVFGALLGLRLAQAFGDVLLLVAAVVVMESRPVGVPRRALGFAALAAAITAVADLSTAALTAHGSYRAGSWSDLGFVWGLVAAGLCVSEWRRVSVPSERRSSRGAHPLGVLTLVATVLGFGALVAASRGLPWFPYQLLAVAAAAVAVLTLTRAVVAAVDNRHLLAQLMRSADQLERQRGYYHALVHSTADVILALDADGRVREVSGSVLPALGRTVEQTIGWTLADVLSSTPRDDVQQALALAARQPGEAVTATGRVRHADGRLCSFDVTITDLLSSRAVGSIVVNLHDVTERDQLLAELSRQAVTDPLTGLVNRAGLYEALGTTLAKAAPVRQHVDLLYCDLDGFKTVNDSYGHDVGDRLLLELAQRLRACVNSPDLLARLGGDEFVVVVAPGRPAEHTEQLTAAIIAACSTPATVAGRQIVVSASVGIATSKAGEPVEQLLHRADQAMYAAKSAGRASVSVDAR